MGVGDFSSRRVPKLLSEGLRVVTSGRLVVVEVERNKLISSVSLAIPFTFSSSLASNCSCSECLITNYQPSSGQNLDVPHVELPVSTLHPGPGSAVARLGVQDLPRLTELHRLGRTDQVAIAVERVGHNVDTAISLALRLQQGVVVNHRVWHCSGRGAAGGGSRRDHHWSPGGAGDGVQLSEQTNLLGLAWNYSPFLGSSQTINRLLVLTDSEFKVETLAFITELHLGVSVSIAFQITKLRRNTRLELTVCQFVPVYRLQW